MTQEQTSAGTTEVTDTSAQTQSQASAARTYSQEEFDNHMAAMKASLSKKLLKPYEDLGDPQELRALREQAQKAEQEQQLKRGEFDKIIQDLAAKKDDEIRKRDQKIEQFMVEQPLIAAAGEYRSVNPEQVKQLLRHQVRLNADGDVEVVDSKGTVRYNDSGKPLQVHDLVKEFLTANPHFVQATPATVNSSHSIRSDVTKVDISKLDMRNPEHRKLYKQTRNKA